MSYFRTAILLAALTAVFMGIGFLIGGQSGMVIALIIAGVMNLFAYWNSDKMVLSMYGAREVEERSAPELYALVRQLAAAAEIPMPRVFVMENPQPNAFATGRNPEHAAVAATTGILRLLNARELRAVLGHELTHVRNRDILTSTVTASIAGAVSTLAQFGMFFGGRDDGNRNPVLALLVLILAPIAAMLIQLAISRAREYEADRGGAEISGDPRSLADALAKIERYAKGLPLETAEAHPATAQMMIINPLSGGGIAGLFATHPPTEERIRRLLAMASA